MKTKNWILLLGVLVLVCAGLSFLLLGPEESAAAQIYSEGKLLCTLDLRNDRTLTVEGSRGTNVVTVKDGKIAVTAADCPDGYCMDRGFCNGGVEIVCLPNRLVIRFLGKQEIDAVSG